MISAINPLPLPLRVVAIGEKDQGFFCQLKMIYSVLLNVLISGRKTGFEQVQRILIKRFFHLQAFAASFSGVNWELHALVPPIN